MTRTIETKLVLGGSGIEPRPLKTLACESANASKSFADYVSTNQMDPQRAPALQTRAALRKIAITSINWYFRGPSMLLLKSHSGTSLHLELAELMNQFIFL